MERTIQKETDHRLGDKIAAWQKVIVFSLINQCSLAEGISFEEIQRKYIQEATTVQDIDLKKEHLQPLVLKKILMDLQCSNLIYPLLNGNYTGMRVSISPRAARVHLDERAKFAIIGLLAKHSGKYTQAELAPHITDEMKITNVELAVLMNELISTKAIIVDGKGKLWLASIPPPK